MVIKVSISINGREFYDFQIGNWSAYHCLVCCCGCTNGYYRDSIGFKEIFPPKRLMFKSAAGVAAITDGMGFVSCWTCCLHHCLLYNYQWFESKKLAMLVSNQVVDKFILFKKNESFGLKSKLSRWLREHNDIVMVTCDEIIVMVIK